MTITEETRIKTDPGTMLMSSCSYSCGEPHAAFSLFHNFRYQFTHLIDRSD